MCKSNRMDVVIWQIIRAICHELSQNAFFYFAKSFWIVFILSNNQKTSCHNCDEMQKL